jgi:DNA helicase-2/ATP-dependent DNA helicase PcrA
MVLAAAGTGKTRVITVRMAELIRRGTRPDRILAVTFTNKAAREMRERAMKLLPAGAEVAPTIGTFHSICVKILREDIGALGYAAGFVIADRSQQESLARQVMREARIDPKELAPGEFLHRVGQWKNRGLRSGHAIEATTDADDRTQRCVALYRAYESALRTMGLVDFDDLLLCTQELFEQHPEILNKHRARYDHLLVDEYQDTNSVQYRILRDLGALHRNVCVVGDDDQSIYGWRGAEIANLKRFEVDFPGAKIVRLEENYRSCPNILQLANQLIRHNKGRYAKELRSTRRTTNEPRFRKFEDETEEASAVVADLAATAARDNIPFRDFAILFRTNEQPRLFEQELRSREIPYTLVGGYSFFDRREIRDILAYLKVIENPSDEVHLLRIANVPPRGLGTTVMSRLLSRAAERGLTLGDVLPEAAVEGMETVRVRSGASALVEVIRRFRQRFSLGSIAEGLRELLSAIQYQGELARQYEEESERQARWDSVGELVNMASQYESRTAEPTLRGFIDNTALATEEDRKDDKENERNAVMLMTMHSAKGLEFRHVYLVGLEMGILPHERSMESASGIEEERRLAYVGVTRARDRLTLSRAMKRRRFGRVRLAEPSIFLAEMLGIVEPGYDPAALLASRKDSADVSQPRGKGLGKSSRSSRR